MQQQKAKEKHTLLSTMNSFNFMQNLPDFILSFISKRDMFHSYDLLVTSLARHQVELLASWD